MFTVECFFCPNGITPKSGLTGPNNTHTHTHTHIYIYMCVCVFIFILLYVCAYTLPIKSICQPSKIFISHPKSIIFKEMS